MIGLEQAKRKVAEIAPVVVSALELIKDHGEPDELDWQGFRIYIRESGGLTRVAKWFLSLTHDLIEEVERLNKQLGSPYDLTVVQSQLDSSRQLVESLQREKAELESKLCGMRSLFIDVKNLVCGEARPRWDLSLQTTMARNRIADLADKALSSTPECKHKEEIEQLRAELKEAKK